MNKKTFSVLVLILSVFGGVCWFSSRVWAATDRYENKEKGFSIAFPTDWEKTEGFMGTTVLGGSPMEGPTDSFRENVNVLVEDIPAGIPLGEYYEVSLKNARDLMTDFQEHESGQMSVDNSDAKWLVYSHRMGKISMKVLMVMLVKGQRGYVITCTAAPDQFEAYRGRFDEIARSFKFE